MKEKTIFHLSFVWLSAFQLIEGSLYTKKENVRCLFYFVKIELGHARRKYLQKIYKKQKLKALNTDKNLITLSVLFFSWLSIVKIWTAQSIFWI